MGKRHEVIGIRQTIRFEWMQKTVNLLLAGLDVKSIRRELHEFLADKRGNGSEGKRSELTRTFVVDNLMRIWGSPVLELISFRDALLAFLRKSPSMDLAIHWGMVSAAYPFWFNVAQQTGRLLALQEQVTHAQIINRLKEQYGDRQTVSRFAQFVIRSFVAWGVLKDSQTKGCYEKTAPVNIADPALAALLFESVLLALSEGKSERDVLLNHPALFPFNLPVMSGDSIVLYNGRIESVRYALDSELLKLKKIGEG
ncbi:MAG: hypothetical protein K6E31_03255 [bacterium]|nr:hypothetical protein [bacterium]